MGQMFKIYILKVYPLMGFSENLIFLRLQLKKNHVSTARLKKKLGKAFMPLVIIRLIYFAESYNKVDIFR